MTDHGQFGAQFLAQGYYKMQTGGAGDHISN